MFLLSREVLGREETLSSEVTLCACMENQAVFLDFWTADEKKQAKVSWHLCCWSDQVTSPLVEVFFELSLPSSMWHRAKAFSPAIEKCLKHQNALAVTTALRRRPIHGVR